MARGSTSRVRQGWLLLTGPLLTGAWLGCGALADEARRDEAVLCDEVGPAESTNLGREAGRCVDGVCRRAME